MIKQIFFIFMVNLFSSCFAQLHVCTVASHEKYGLRCLKKSCERYGINLKVLGFGKPYQSNITKLFYIKKFIENLKNDDILLFIDAYDVLFFGSEEEVLNKFLSMKAPFVIAAEKNCHKAACGNQDFKENYPESPTIFRYLNSGCYIGYVWAIKDILNNLSYDIHKKSDQYLFNQYYMKNQNKFRLDTNCEIFCCLVSLSAQKDFVQIEERVKCNITNTIPLILHGNGKSGKKILFGIYDKLYKN